MSGIYVTDQPIGLFMGRRGHRTREVAGHGRYELSYVSAHQANLVRSNGISEGKQP